MNEKAIRFGELINEVRLRHPGAAVAIGPEGFPEADLLNPPQPSEELTRLSVEMALRHEEAKRGMAVLATDQVVFNNQVRV